VIGPNSDHVVRFVQEQAGKNQSIEQVYLFGSRARGDFREKSDYDFAVVISNDERWPEWALHVREKAPTLCGIDLVKFDDMTATDMRSVILKEGRLIYERAK
jgi:predicted nucleotidyltransferase